MPKHQYASATFRAYRGAKILRAIRPHDGLEILEGRIAPAGADLFANAAVLFGILTSDSGSNVGATGEVGEPDHAGLSTPLNSVWWMWTAPADGVVTIDTIGSGYDTTLAVYTGSAVNALTAIASNDDLVSGNLQSQVSFSATAGTSYYVAVDGYQGSTGNYILNLKEGTLSAVLSGNDLTITDSDGAGRANDLTVVRSGGNLIITDATERFGSAPAGGALSNEDRTLTIPFITGILTFNTGGASDSLIVDLSGGDVIPNGGLYYNGGDPTIAPGDKLTISGGIQGTVTYDYTNAHDGSVDMSGYGKVTYSQLEPITNTGSATDIIFNLPTATANAAALSNFGTSSDGLSTLSGGTFERTTFSNPTGSITVNRGTASDTLSLGSLPDVTSQVTLGSAGAPFAGLDFAGSITLAANKSLTAFSSGNIALSTAASDLATSGTGAVSLTAGKAISVFTGGSITVSNGALTLSANATQTGSGNFVGIELNGALASSGTGAISLSGTGGDTGGSNHGIYFGRVSTGSISSTGGGAVTVDGRGGLGAGGDNDGIIMERSSTIASNGNITLTGTIGAINAGNANEGLNFDTGDSITTSGAANITLITDAGFLIRAATINAGSNTVTLKQKTAGTPINVGTYGNLFAGIPDNYLDSIAGGTVQIGDATSGQITVSAPITHLNSNAISLTAGVGQNINLNGSLTTAGGALTFGNALVLGANASLDTTNAGAVPAGAAINIPSTINLGSSLLTLNAGATNNAITGLISGSGGQLTKQGAGTLTLTNSNSYAGATIVGGGTLALQGNSGSSSFAISSGAVLELNATVTRDYTASTTFTGTGTLRKTGGGTVQWGASGATFAFSAGALIDVQAGRFTGGSSANENWSSNLSDLNVAASAVFNGVEANVRVDKITGAGTIASGYPGAGYSTFTFGVNGGSATFTGNLANNPDNVSFVGNFTKAGAGTITLSTAHTYTGATAVTGGTLSVTGSLATSAATVASGATLTGTGTISGTVAVASGSILAPGLSTGIIATGSLNLASGSSYPVEINSAVPGTGYDQANVTGTVSLNGANLVIVGTSSIASSRGQQIVLIKNDGTDAVTGTFNSLPEGASISVNGVSFTISYAGGAGGNDVTLTQTGGTWYTSDGVGGGALEVRLAGSNLQFLDDGTIVDSRPVGNLTNQTVTVSGVNGQNETLFVNFGAGGFFDVDIAWSGGVGVSDNDALRIGGGAFTTVTHMFTAGGPEHSGNIVYNTAASAQSTISYTGLEPIDMTGSTISDLVFNSLGGNAVLEDDGTAGNNVSRVRSVGGLFETTTFSTPTGSLRFNMGSDSATFTVSSADSLFNSSLTIDGEGGADSVIVSSALVLGSATSNGHLTLTAEGITLSANLRTDASTTGTHGNVQLNGPVTIGANVTIDTDGAGTDGSASFLSTINGDVANTRSLTIATGVGALSFWGAIGGSASLNALSTTSGGALALPATTIGSGSLSVTTTGAITANGAIQGGGLVTLTARDTITLAADVVSTGGNLAYTSTLGAITRTAGTSSGSLLTVSAATGITLTTDVATLNLTNSTSGNITITEASGVAVALAQTSAGNGSITITNTGANTNIQLSGLVSVHGAGNIDIYAQGELTLNDVVFGDDVVSASGSISLRANAGVHFNSARVLTAGDALIQADVDLAGNTGPIDTAAGGLVTANNLVVNAAQGIALNTSVNTLTATNTFSNAITINEANGVALNQVSNVGRDVLITLAAGAITDNNGAGQNVIGARSRLVAPTGIGTSIDSIETSLGNFEATATSNGVFIAETDSLTIGGVTGSNGVSANTGAVTISSGSLTLDEDISTSGVVTLNSTGSVGGVFGGVKNASVLNVNSVAGQQLVGPNTVASFNSSNTTSGDVTLLNTTSTLTVVRIANIVGNATVSNSSNVQLGDNTGQNVSVGGIANIVATTGSITDGHSPTPDDGAPINNIFGTSALLTSSFAIGGSTNAIETAVAFLEASTGAGGVFITEVNSLTVGGISPTNGVSSTTGQVRINSGALLIQERVGTTGNVTLTASGSITETGAGFISASLLTTSSNGGQLLGGPNTVGTFTATNVGAGSGVLLENTFAGFAISTITSQTGGDIYINNAGNGATVTGLVRSGNPVLGGDITIQTGGLLTVNAVVDSRGGSGGTLTLGGQINVNTSPIVGLGNVTLQGGPGTLNVFAPITVSSPLVLRSTVDVNILAKVETTSVLADITVLADMDGDGLGGVYVGPNGASQGQLKAGRNLDVRGSEYQGTAPGAAALANLDNSVIIQPNGSTPRLEALGNILVKNNGSAPFDGQIWLGGLVRSNTNGDVAFDNAVLVTSSSARVQSHSDGDVIFVGTVNSATGGTSPYNLSISAGEGVALFNGAVGGVNPLGNVSIDSALDVTVTATFAAQTLLITDATGTVEFGGAVTTTGTGTNLSVNAVNLLINGPINATAPAAALGNILLQVNNLTVASAIAGDGILTIQPRDVSRSIGLNEAGDLNLDSAELNFIQNGFSQIVVGRADGSGLLSIGARTGASAWQDPVVFRAPAAGGAIALLGETAGTGDASFTFLAPNVTVDVPTTPTVSTAGGLVQIGSFTAPAATTLESDLEIQTAGGAVTIVGTINGANALTIDADAGSVYINGNTTPVPTGTSIGGQVPLIEINISGGLLTLRPNMRTQGDQTYTGTSIHLLGGDFRTFDDAGGDVTFNGAVVLESAITITTTNSDVAFNGRVDNIASHATTAGRGALRLTVGSGNIVFGDDVGQTFAPKTIEIVSAGLVELGNDGTDNFKGGASVIITAEEVDFDGDVSVPGGILSITNKLDAQAIVVGGAEVLGSPELHLSDADLAALGNTTASILIGRRAGSGTADLTIADNATFRDPVIFQQPSKTSGPIVIDGDLIGTDNASFTFNGPATRLNADITTAGGAVDIENAVAEAPLSTIDTSASIGGSVTFRGSVTGLIGGEDITVNAGGGTIWLNTGTKTPLTATLAGTLTLTASGLTKIERGLTIGALVVDGGGAIALKGSITTTEDGGQDYDDAVRLTGAVNLTSRHADGTLHFGGTVDSDPAQPTKKYNLNITNRSLSPSGTTVQFDAAIGAAQSLGNLKVNTTGDVIFGAAANVTASGLSLRGDAFTVQDVVTTGAQVYYGTGAFDGIITALKLSVTSTADIVNAGGAWTVTQLANLTAKNADISITGAGNTFGELSLKGVNATVEEDGNMLLRATSLKGTLDVKTTATSEAGNIAQGAAKLTAFRLEASAAGALSFLRPDTRLTQLGDLSASADLTLLVRGARYVLLDGVINAVGDVLLAANPFGKGSSFSTGGNNISITAGGRWVVYSNYAQYPADGTDLIAQLGPDFSIANQAHPFAAPAGMNVLVFTHVMA